MRVAARIEEVRNQIKEWRQTGLSVGFVPTMGYLHEGHLSLIKQAKKENDRVVVSIFVNPTQFSQNEDLASYPIDFVNDQKSCDAAGVDLIFHPENQEMYPSGFQTYVQAYGVTEVLEGQSRPTHFRGVTTVVLKLLQIVQPDRVYFGQKDAQQVVVIQQMVRDLNVPSQIVTCPIIRETDGLAKSSRNVYLSSDERIAARVLNRALMLAQKKLEDGVREVKELIQTITEEINKEPLATIDYVCVVDRKTLRTIEVVEGLILVPIAVYIGKTRLIDNFYWSSAQPQGLYS